MSELPLMNNSFDAAYYRRFYLNQRTRVISRIEMERKAALIAGMVSDLEIPVRRILDAGCGLGWMRKPLLRGFPKATYVGVEVSAHLCERYGWRQSSVADFIDRRGFDLILCNDVVQYLPDRLAGRAIRHFGEMCRGALYFHTPTALDWRRNADHECSDGAVHLRSGAWYRARLNRWFRPTGFGLYVRRGAPVLQWELQRCD